LAFTYGNAEIHDTNRLLCIAKHLFEIQEEHKLSDKGLFKRFSKPCIGKPESLNDLRDIRAKKYEKFIKDGTNTKKNPEYEEWFLNYKPSGDPSKSVINKTKRALYLLKTKFTIPSKSTKRSRKDKKHNHSKTKKSNKYWKL
jgi:hypothetical protein